MQSDIRRGQTLLLFASDSDEPLLLCEMHGYGMHIGEMLKERGCVSGAVYVQSESHHHTLNHSFDTGEIHSLFCSQASPSKLGASCVARHVKAEKGKTSKRQLGIVGFLVTAFCYPSPSCRTSPWALRTDW